MIGPLTMHCWWVNYFLSDCASIISMIWLLQKISIIYPFKRETLIKHKQEQKLAVQALQSGKYVMAMLVQLVSARPLFMRALSTDGWWGHLIFFRSCVTSCGLGISVMAFYFLRGLVQTFRQDNVSQILLKASKKFALLPVSLQTILVKPFENSN